MDFTGWLLLASRCACLLIRLFWPTTTDKLQEMATRRYYISRWSGVGETRLPAAADVLFLRAADA
jgi:hypothetical protein